MNSPSAYFDFLIIGASASAYYATHHLREKRSNASIGMIYDEDRLPYKRTKINKFFLEGFGQDDFAFQPMEAYREQNISLIRAHVARISARENEVILEDGRRFSFKKLLLATGADARTLNVPTDGMIHFMRTAKDAEVIKAALPEIEKVLLIGGGVQSLELASEMHRCGKEVVIACRNGHLMSSLIPQPIEEHLKKHIASLGISVLSSGEFIGIKRKNGQLHTFFEKVEVDADFVIASIGISPRIELAEKAGLKTARGILVNQFFQTSSENIYAAGDGAEYPGSLSVELWHAAQWQGVSAANHMMGLKQERKQPPFRLKTSVFGQFLFSMNYGQTKDLKLKIIQKENQSQYFYFDERMDLVAAVMMNDKARSKEYEQAVLQSWSEEKVSRILALK